MNWSTLCAMPSQHLRRAVAAVPRKRENQRRSVARRPPRRRLSVIVNRVSLGRESAFLYRSLSVTRRGPARLSAKCLYLQTHCFGCVQPLNGNGGASLDRYRTLRACSDARQHVSAGVVTATACQGLVTR